jgi:hypothetical protein
LQFANERLSDEESALLFWKERTEELEEEVRSLNGGTEESQDEARHLKAPLFEYNAYAASQTRGFYGLSIDSSCE